MKTPEPELFRSGRQFAAWIGLTPKDHSTAGKVRLGVNTRAGDEGLRGALVAQVAEWSKRHRCCATCGERRRVKGSYPTTFRTLYGDVELNSPRLHRCACRGVDGPATVSPLRALLPHHIAPERLYLEARWASLIPYAAAAGLLADILPITSGTNATTLREHVLHVAEGAEAELGEERPCFIDGCPAEWQALPIPEGRVVVGLDGGYVRNWEDRKTNFEVIVGRSMPEDRDDLNRNAGCSTCSSARVCRPTRTSPS